MSRLGSRTVRRVAMAVLALGAAVPAAVYAQGVGNGPSDPEPVVFHPTRQFRLFGLADEAVTGMRQGGNSYWHTTNSGPGDDNPSVPWDLPGRVIGVASSPTSYCCGYFELQLYMAVSRGDWSKARDVIPSLENVKGGGWAASTNLARWVPDNLWSMNGRNGSVGTLFSGATSSSDGSCRDNRARANAFISAGVPLLAGSDCPDTWVDKNQFGGEHPVADTTFLRYFKADPTNFTFDDRGIPESERPQDKLYGSFQTFGAVNDYGRERLLRFGSVIPGGSGASSLEGYPIGVEWDFNAWTYQVPTIADGMFWKVYIVNKSAEIYGVGIDYDSLYLGFMNRPFHTTSTQQPAIYAVPWKGAVFSAQTNINTQNCYGAVHGANVTGGYTAGTGIRSCLSNTHNNRGFRGGAGGFIVFQSPIGDLRNKKFSDPSSPFYSPGNVHAGDTITFNMVNACGFSCATTTGLFGGSARAAYGTVTNHEEDALAGIGKASGDLTQLQYFDLFHNQDWPLRWGPATGNVGGFNKYVPGNWDWNKDGQQDTLKLLTCSPAGCEQPWVDTLPGGWPNGVHNNYFAGVGPIKLKAGDTTSLTVAWISSPDSVTFENTVNNFIDLYQNFWLSPEPPQPANIVSAVPTGGNRQYDTFVRLYLDQTLNAQQDKFLFEAAKALRADTGIINRTLKALNPRLPNQMFARALPRGTIIADTVPYDTSTTRVLLAPPTAAQVIGCRTAYTATQCQIVTDTAIGVVDSVYVFKSCDGGVSFTASSGTTCVPAPSKDVAGAAPRYPWQAYATLGRDASGNFPSTYTDGGVTGGLTYTYVITGKSYPAVFTINKVVGNQIVQATYTVRPATLNGLTTNTANRNVSVLYVPASLQSSSDTAGVVLSAMPGDTIAAFSVSARLGKSIRGTSDIAGRLVISDSAEITTFDSDTSVAGITSTKVKLFYLADTAWTGAVPTRVSYRVDSFFVAESLSSVDVAGKRLTLIRKDSVSATPGDRSKWTFWRYAGRGPQATLYSNGNPVYVTDTFPTNSDITPGATIARPTFNGLLVTFDPSKQRQLLPPFWSTPQLGVLNTPSNPTMTWSGGTARDPVASYSHYRLTFGDREFGPNAPFTIDRASPGNLTTQYNASLAARKAVANSDVSATAAAALSAALGRPITTDSLAAMTLPFTVQDLRTNKAVTVAVLRSQHPTTALLGIGGDTVRVSVPADRWIPGDPIYFVQTFTTFRTDTANLSPLRERVKLVNGTADTTTVTRVTWGPGNLACGSPTTCNPISGIGGTGYTAVSPNESLELLYYAPFGGNVFTPGTGLYAFNYAISPERSGTQISSSARPDLSQVRVVPNPYVMFSQYEQTVSTKRLLFTHLPPTGTIRIYTASGQFVQQLAWTANDLERNCTATVSTTSCEAAGDLFWNMRTREDLLIGPGFYVFVVNTTVNGKKASKLGKFVIIH